MPTVRANLTDLEHRQFTVFAAREGLKPTQKTEQLVRGFLAEQIRLHPSIVAGIVEVVEETRTRHITTRQLAKLKELCLIVPGCTVNNSHDRILTYPLRFEAVVIDFLSKCPKGSKNERARQETKRVYKPMSPTAKPGLKAAKKKYESKHVRID